MVCGFHSYHKSNMAASAKYILRLAEFSNKFVIFTVQLHRPFPSSFFEWVIHDIKKIVLDTYHWGYLEVYPFVILTVLLILDYFLAFVKLTVAH